jgi:hypothetical protein
MEREPAYLNLSRGRLIVPHLWRSPMWTPELAEECELPHDIAARIERGEIWGGQSFNDYLELKVLDHIFNDAAYTAPSPFLGLWTAALTDASTGATASEANYTGYARLTIAAADMSAAAAGSKTNANVLTFAACTGGTSTITYWGICDSGTTGAGNMLVWGTATSTVISTTQTPATVAAGGLVVNLN